MNESDFGKKEEEYFKHSILKLVNDFDKHSMSFNYAYSEIKRMFDAEDEELRETNKVFSLLYAISEQILDGRKGGVEDKLKEIFKELTK